VKFVVLCVLLIATGCHKDEPPAPTAEQADQLNDAEAMLNAMSNNAEGPETNAPGPSNSDGSANRT
jgi:hypothetical protein